MLPTPLLYLVPTPVSWAPPGLFILHLPYCAPHWVPALLSHLHCRYCDFHFYYFSGWPRLWRPSGWCLSWSGAGAWLVLAAWLWGEAFLCMADDPLVSVVYSTLRLDFIVHRSYLLQWPQKVNVSTWTKQTAYKEIPIVYGLLCVPTIHAWTQWICRKMGEGSV